MDKTLKSDFCEVLSDDNIPWHKLENAVALITGATGLIGSYLIGVLAAANAHLCHNMRLLGHGRDTEIGEKLIRQYAISFISGDIREPLPETSLPSEIDYIFHCAAITDSAQMKAKPAEVIETAAIGTRNILNLAMRKRCKSLVFLSSMEVYGQTKQLEVRECDLGYLDLSNPRSSYPESKRLCEALCAAYNAQYKAPNKIARLAQTFGAGTPKDDTRVFAQFARSAIAGDNIELHTKGESMGNYCYISDAVRGLLTILLKGKTGEAYNIANPAASATIREMAETVASRVSGGKVKVVTKAPDDIEKRGYAPDTYYTLNVDKLKALGWEPRHTLEDMYRRMIAHWQDT